LQALDTQYDLMIGQGRLDRGLRELIFACAASARGDEYLAHAMAASGEGRSDAETCLLMWVRKMATMPHKTVEEDMKRLHSAGWRDQEIVEALTVVSLSAYTSIMSLTLKLA
jgi:alkylhydroperoxidase family enzyme